MILNSGQREGVRKIVDFKNKANNDLFLLSGYAGTGKSTILSIALEELGLTYANYVVLTFTGRAALNLIKKGVSAQTIHSFCYQLTEEVEKVVDERGVERKVVTGRKWKLKSKEAIDEDLRLIVIDEFSMVSQKILDDLRKFEIPILGIGDDFQLPAIGQRQNLLANPDHFLDTIMRQAESNPIIHLSMLVRNGKPIDTGIYKDGNINRVAVITPEQRTDQMLIKSSQIICGKNATRTTLNTHMRRILHNTDRPLPVPGDKIICSANNSTSITPTGSPLTNGLIGYNVSEPARIDLDRDSFRMNFVDGDDVQNGVFEKAHSRYFSVSLSGFVNATGGFDADGIKAFKTLNDFKTPMSQKRMAKNRVLSDVKKVIQSDTTLNKSRFIPEDENEKLKKLKGFSKTKTLDDTSDINKFDYGYAISCHKAQGSEFDKVYAIEEILNSDMHDRWLYTLITRAKDRLILELAPRFYYY